MFGFRFIAAFLEGALRPRRPILSVRLGQGQPLVGLGVYLWALLAT